MQLLTIVMLVVGLVAADDLRPRRIRSGAAVDELRPRRTRGDVAPDEFRPRRIRGGAHNRKRDDDDDAAVTSWVVDATTTDCTGVFWRTQPDDSTATQIGPKREPWPRNGAVVKGILRKVNGKDWVEMTETARGYFLPVVASGHGKTAAVLRRVNVGKRRYIEDTSKLPWL